MARTDGNGRILVKMDEITEAAPLAVEITDGTSSATVRNLAVNDALNVAVVDANGNQVTSFGGGTSNTEYTEGATDATITGIVGMMEGAADVIVPMQGTVASGLLVDLGANNDVTVTGTVTAQDGGGSLTIDGTVAVSSVGGTVAISAISLPLPTGAATSALQTQPGVDIGDVTVNNGVAGAAVNVQDGGNSLTVDGTVTANAGTNLNTSTLALESGGNLATAATALGVMDDWDNAASDGASISGDVAHAATDAGEPVKIGATCNAAGTDPIDVANAQRSNLKATRAGMQYVIGGHPATERITANYTGAQANTILKLLTSGQRFVVTAFDAFVSNACTVNVSVLLEFDDTVDVRVVEHPAVAPGSGFVVGNGAGILAISGDAQDVLITVSVPTGGSISIGLTGYTEG